MRFGLRISAVRYNYASSEKALEPLWEEITRMGITSIHEQPETEEEFFENESCDNETVLDDEIAESEREIRQQPLDLVFDPEEKEAAPKTIHEVLQLKPAFLDRIIIKILKSRPNHSCIRNNLPTEILKLWDVKSRCEPRERFAKKVNAQIAVMARKGYVIIYKSKNVRVKLGWVDYPGK